MAALVEVRDRTIVFDDGKETIIPDSVTIADKTPDGEPSRWQLGNDVNSIRVMLNVGDTDDTVGFRLRKVTPKK